METFLVIEGLFLVVYFGYRVINKFRFIELIGLLCSIDFIINYAKQITDPEKVVIQLLTVMLLGAIYYLVLRPSKQT